MIYNTNNIVGQNTQQRPGRFPRFFLFLTVIIGVSFPQISCKKYLEKKRYQNQAIPSTLKDLQAILDHNENIAYSPGYLEFVADNFYLESSSWSNATTKERGTYIWDSEVRPADNIWNAPYEVIYRANFVLDHLPKIVFHESERKDYNNVTGQALFFRSFMFYQLAQLFCRPYSTSADRDMGIVLRLTSAVEAPSTRSTVKQTYLQVIADLKSAADLLPTNSLVLTRPNRAAAFGLLARVYLSMQDYVNAGKYASFCLAENKSLLDYNFLTPVSDPFLPVYTSNPEILFLSYETNVPDMFNSSHQALIDSFLYQSYDLNDLRKTVFFGNGTSAGTYYWEGSYSNFSAPYLIFDGIATDEIYLISAECKARDGNTNGAMDDLNDLLYKRFKPGFPGLNANNATDALNIILLERRKELLFRGLRWTDLRRFNLENRNITLTRNIDNDTYTLPPDDPRWVLLIPDLEINRSGIPQNPR